jgi:hypothetical protein
LRVARTPAPLPRSNLFVYALTSAHGDDGMAGTPEFDINNPGEMDYPEHQRTYNRFLAMTKWATILIAALLVGMLVGLIMGAGVIASVLSFVIILAIAWFFFR